MNMKKSRTHITPIAPTTLSVTLLAALTLPLCPALAQDTSRNFVRTETMLDAEGTDSIEAVQYYPTMSITASGSCASCSPPPSEKYHPPGQCLPTNTVMTTGDA
jgi:hypothetical protein